jgi:hypothetical protein
VATAVTLARVLASGANTSAPHVGGDLTSAVLLPASVAGNDGHVDLAQSRGDGTAARGGCSPGSMLA